MVVTMCASMQRAIMQRDYWSMGQAGPKRYGPFPATQAHVPGQASPIPPITHNMHQQSRLTMAHGAKHTPTKGPEEEIFILRYIIAISINARCNRPDGCPNKEVPFHPHPLDTCERHDSYIRLWMEGTYIGPEPKPQMHKS